MHLADRSVQETFNKVLENIENYIAFTFKEVDKAIERDFYNPQRNQCCFETILDLNGDSIRQSLIVLEDDLYSNDLNWCFGGYSPSHDCIIISTARIRSENHLYDLIGHEIGHFLGMCTNDRVNTVEMLGMHCTNDLCVMQQKMTVKDALEHTYARHAINAPLYCDDCLNDVKELLIKNEKS